MLKERKIGGGETEYDNDLKREMREGANKMKYFL